MLHESCFYSTFHSLHVKNIFKPLYSNQCLQFDTLLKPWIPGNCRAFNYFGYILVRISAPLLLAHQFLTSVAWQEVINLWRSFNFSLLMTKLIFLSGLESGLHQMNSHLPAWYLRITNTENSVNITYAKHLCTLIPYHNVQICCLIHQFCYRKTFVNL
jgi:hypothetical protein